MSNGELGWVEVFNKLFLGMLFGDWELCMVWFLEDFLKRWKFDVFLLIEFGVGGGKFIFIEIEESSGVVWVSSDKNLFFILMDCDSKLIDEEWGFVFFVFLCRVFWEWELFNWVCRSEV